MPSPTPENPDPPAITSAPDAEPGRRGSAVRRWAPVLLVLAGIALVSGMAVLRPFSSQAPVVSVQEAYVGAGADPAGGYLVLRNDGGGDDLVGVDIAGANVALQRRVLDATTGVSELREAASLRLPGYEEVRLQPGGDQLLLTGITPLTGTTVSMTLRFRVSDPIVVEAPVLTYDEIGQVLLPPRLQVPAGS